MHTFVENYIVIYVWILSIYVWNSKKVWRATRRTLLRLCESTRSLWQWKWSFSKPENKKLQILHDLNWFLLSSFFYFHFLSLPKAAMSSCNNYESSCKESSLITLAFLCHVTFDMKMNDVINLLLSKFFSCYINKI